MNYESMVKEAYEEILGLEKEAKAKKKEDEDREYIDDSLVYTARKAGRGALTGAGIGAGIGVGLGGIPLATSTYLREKLLGAPTGKALGSALGTGALGALGLGTGGALSGAAIGAGYGAIHGNNVRRMESKKKKAQQEAAEKAAAYYDEAQLAKEAAEANYTEACAYEEAALSILEELGHFEKEAANPVSLHAFEKAYGVPTNDMTEEEAAEYNRKYREFMINRKLGKRKARLEKYERKLKERSDFFL